MSRWGEVLDRFGPASSWSAYRGLMVSYTKLGRIEEAEETAIRAREVFPESVDLGVAWAEVAMGAPDWPGAVGRWEEVLDRFDANAPWSVYARLAVAHGELGDLDTAAGVLTVGRERFPDEVGLLSESAELAMALRDWPGAVRWWNEAVDARVGSRSERPPDRMSFPRRGSQWDWFEEAWREIVREWDRVVDGLEVELSPSWYGALATTLVNAGLSDEALEMLRVGVEVYPENRLLAFDLAAHSLESDRDRGQTVRVADLSRRLMDHHPLMASVCVEAAGATASSARVDGEVGHQRPGPITRIHASNLETLAGFAPTDEDTSGELGSVRVIRVPHGSSIELELKAGRYFTQSIIEQRVREVSERDAWEEMTSPENLMFKRARALADDFGRRFEDLPLLNAGALSDAVLSFVFEELAVYEPMRRLAIDIASEADNSPVLIESPTDTFRYVDGYFFSNFDVLYLYFELRKRGVNAFLFRHHSGKAPIRTQLHFTPGIQSLTPRGDVRETPRIGYERGLVPAGIRSVRRVLDTLGPTLVFSSGSVVKEFAYDRSLNQEYPIEPEASIHPPLSALPTFRFDLWPAATLRGVSLRAEDGLESPHATIEVSEEIGGDWMLWLDRALHDYLAGIFTNSVAEIAARGIEEAHVCDHLFADGVLFADAVKQSGGRVVLWPHTANPVHVNERRPGSFDEVHAVTWTGCEQWRERFPDVQVTHSPLTMLNPLIRNTRIDP
ncbi:MAG: tetratricopeptide repeat protein, partial [Actinomycetota bacterium]|nr:tetratricopeptide repeat protein [Actinomycetota bacterium]